MPTILKQDGFRFFFYSREGCEPAHIHIIGHGGEMKVWLEPVRVSKIFKLSPKRQKQALIIVDENLDLFIKEWENKHG